MRMVMLAYPLFNPFLPLKRAIVSHGFFLIGRFKKMVAPELITNAFEHQTNC
jgi:hypothetical protein